MRETRYGEDVGELRRKTRVRSRFILVVLLRLLGALDAEVRSVIGTFAMHQGNESLVGQFLLSAIRDRNFGRTLHGDVAAVGVEVMDRKTFHKSAAFHAANRRAPSVLCE